MGLIKIDNSRCKSCYLCVNTCPKGLIKKTDKTNRLGDYLVEFDDKNNECYLLKDLKINGRDLEKLGYKGKEIGIKLNQILDIVMKEPNLNNKENIIKLLKYV